MGLLSRRLSEPAITDIPYGKLPGTGVADSQFCVLSHASMNVANGNANVMKVLCCDPDDVDSIDLFSEVCCYLVGGD